MLKDFQSIAEKTMISGAIIFNSQTFYEHIIPY